MIAVKIYTTKEGVRPFSKWFAGLPVRLAEKVDDAIYRMQCGNLGDHKSVGGGVYERRIFGNPAMRLYFGMEGKVLVILLAGGFKDTQGKDIATAHALWEDYRQRKKDGESLL